MKKLLFSAIAILAFSAISFGQSHATATAETTLIIPISIANSVPLNFGTIASSQLAGSTSIASSSAGTVTLAGGVTQVASGATPTAAKFTVTGDGASQISVLYPSEGPILLTNTIGANTLSLVISAPSSGTTANLAGGTLDIYVGGTLTVPEATVAGTYKNTTDLTVTVNYN